MDYDIFCKRCQHYQFSMANGITCGLTNAKPDFVDKCEDFELDAERDAELQRKKPHASSSYTPEPEKLGFSWGAFGLTGLWLLFHGKVGMFFVLLVLSFIPIIGQVIVFVMALNYGFNGRSIAWDHGNYRSIEELKQGEMGWDVAGIVVFILMIVIAFGYLFSI